MAAQPNVVEYIRLAAAASDSAPKTAIGIGADERGGKVENVILRKAVRRTRTKNISRMSGYHEVVYDDGDQYKGEWNADGKRDGTGQLTFADGSRYAGKFTNGMCHGLGVLTFPDSTKYEGEFQNGKYHGFGVYQRADGMRFEGCYRDGQANGPGLLTFADGTNGRPRQEGDWTGHKLVGRKNVAAEIAKAQDAATNARIAARQ